MGLPLEIERKFLVTSKAFMTESSGRILMRQGYLSTDPQRVVRVRLTEDLESGEQGAFLTIKGLFQDHGLSRLEWEQPIDYQDGVELLALCLPFPVEKTRYLVPVQDLTFEVDVFHESNQGLIVAEIELPDPEAQFTEPDWLGVEVTQQTKYTNASLAQIPFSTWTK
jgi:CYTH domain-containing protein